MKELGFIKEQPKYMFLGGDIQQYESTVSLYAFFKLKFENII